MNILKLKSILCSLMAIALVTVFLTSCEKNDTLPTTNEVNIDKNEDDVIYFKLSESFDNMSDEKLNEFLQDKTKEEILDMAVEVLENNLDSRWCTSATSIWTSCQYSHNCGGRRYVTLKKKYCDSRGWFYYLSYGSCC